MAYAAQTKVSVAKTKSEIEAIIEKYGAENFATMNKPGRAMIAFKMEGRHILFRLPLPRKDADEFRIYKRGYQRVERSEDAALAKWEQACRSRWRGLFLCIKAKLESVEAGIETFDDAFLAHISVGGGDTVADRMKPHLEQIGQGGPLPPLLPAPEN